MRGVVDVGGRAAIGWSVSAARGLREPRTAHNRAVGRSFWLLAWPTRPSKELGVCRFFWATVVSGMSTLVKKAQGGMAALEFAGAGEFCGLSSLGWSFPIRAQDEGHKKKKKKEN